MSMINDFPEANEEYKSDADLTNMELIKHIHEINDDKRNKLKAKFENITLPIFLRKFENIVTYNHQHFVRGKLTWADIFFASIANSIGKLINNTSYLDKYHNLKKLTEKVLSIEAIQSWLENPEYIVV
ncbi:Hypothetical protein CINCED_3A004503 [Cinara cedri]|uniref:GST C-terminal domain-containing protein n=1 Tax=Cinara cedri TaxID=506608 RepID=A0A5E4MX66_9HEMI|nr:Hypothetical protein CINCED_3A004503 [Cinara cedri]